MGFIRTLLALAVVLEHTVGTVIVGGMLAVQLFYMISGYLMSLILTEGSAYKSNAVFFRNRALRLYPIYFVVAGMTLIAYLILHAIGTSTEFWRVYEHINTPADLALALANITLFGQDWVMFLVYNDGVLSFAKSFTDSEVRIQDGLLVPQAWTLGIEISFYLIAPFVLRRPKLLLILLAGSLALRAWLIAIGIGMSDPWTHRFFPNELALFLLGAVSHQWIRPLIQRYMPGSIADRAPVLAVGFIVLFCLVVAKLPHPVLFQGVLVGCFILLMPLLFAFQNNRAWDGRIGDLSYPLYICHMLVILIVTKFLGLTEGPWKIALVVAGSFVLAWLLEHYINQPVERLRRSFKQRAAENAIMGSESAETTAIQKA